VPKLFEVERYPTLLQMTSTVQAQTRAPLSQIVANMFPCASITGAPKVRTMQIIKELEPQPRGVYTGSIGFPGARWNGAV
jgi:para-aminobenzoate synthetase/4-amino-4-deoxychorismate lyase